MNGLTLRVVLLALATATTAAAQDWPRFRGPGGAGLSDADPPESFTAEDYNWRVELPGKGHSSPVVWGDKVFVTCATDSLRKVLCLAAGDGRVLWSRDYAFEPVRMHKLNGHASATPAVDAERVVVSWRTGMERTVLALNHAGEKLWERATGAFAAAHGATSSPVLVEGVVVVAQDNEGEHESSLTGLDAAKGETVWTRKRETRDRRAAFSTPAVRAGADGKPEVVFSSTAHGLTALDPKTGALRWEVDGLFDSRCVGSPVAAGEIVFATAGTGGGGKESAAVALRADGPEVLYRLRRGLPYVPTPVIVGENLFLWSDGGMVSCVRLETGEEVWRERVEGSFYGSPICAGGRLYAMSNEGELVILDAAATFEVPERIDLGEPTQATPAVAGDVLYLRTERHLISVGGI